MTPQTLTITIEFQTDHTPDTPHHLEHVAIHYFKGKGIIMCDRVIRI